MGVSRQEFELRLKRFKAVAREVGVKITHQRLEIFRAVAENPEHPSAESVYRSVQATTPTITLETVHRTLWLLADLGLLNTLGPRHDSIRFDANVDNHHHYVCVRCGLVRDIGRDELKTLTIPESVSRFGKVLNAHVELQGICEDCSKAPSRETPILRHTPARGFPRLKV